MLVVTAFIAVILVTSRTSIAKANTWLAVTENFPPYNYLKDGAAAGYATELIRHLEAESGIHFMIEVLPWSRAMLLASSKPNVLIYSMLRTPEREPHYHWVGAIDDLSIYMWALKREETTTPKPNSLLSYAVSRSLDELNTRMLVEHFGAQAHKIIAVETTEQLIGMLLKARVDRILLAENIWRKLQTSLPEAQQNKLQRLDLVAQRELYVALSIQTDIDAAHNLQSAFQRISTQSSIIALRDAHGIY